MERRDFLRHAGLISAGLALPGRSRLLASTQVASSPASSGAAAAPAGWRTFEVTTHVEVLQPSGRTRVWLPMPLTVDTPYQKALGNSFHVEGGTATSTNDPAFANGIACIEWPEGVKPVVFLTSRVATHDHAVDLTQPQPLRRTSGGATRGGATRGGAAAIHTGAAPVVAAQP